MITFFDTETTGLPKDWKAPMTDLQNWPRVIQLAWMVTDLKGEIINQKELLIKPDGWIIPVEKFWIDHGFSTETSLKKGVPMLGALAEFSADLAQCEFLVSHNMDFDHKVLGSEMIRHDVKAKRLQKICTKEAATDFCKIPFAGRRDYRPGAQKAYKWPKLEELHLKLFGQDFTEKHQAGGDVVALKNCFFELVRLGVIQIEMPTV